MSTATSTEQFDPYEDYWPTDRFYDAYEQYCIGLIDEPPKITDLDERDHTVARQFATFLDWKYENGLEESMGRDIGTYEQMNELFLRVDPKKFAAWLGRLAEDA